MEYLTKTKTLPICSQSKEYLCTISEGFSIKLVIEKNPFNLPIESLFAMAARKNKKRSFLFVSKVLGKHISVNPYTPLLAGALLASYYFKQNFGDTVFDVFQISEALSDPLNNQHKLDSLFKEIKKHPFSMPKGAIFIGFAETATALGHSVFDCFSAEDVHYIHTTREKVLDFQPIIGFSEEHSHAVSHCCYSPNSNLLASQNPVILIDDEITTGKTALNIIAAIQQEFPRKEYVVLSLLDWRSQEDRQRFSDMEKSLGVSIKTLALLEGSFNISGQLDIANFKSQVYCNFNQTETNLSIESIKVSPCELVKCSSEDESGNIFNVPYLYGTGRFGINCRDRNVLERLIEKTADRLQKIKKGKRVLCLGTGEFMYIPMRVAAKMGVGYYQSTTRSPIFPNEANGYGIQCANFFSSPDDASITNYLYNVPHEYYDEVILFVERFLSEKHLQPIIQTLSKLGVERIVIVTWQ